MAHPLKSLWPSLLLIAVYFVADEFFGPVAGIYTALVLGGAEFTYTWLREKRFDKMVLLTTLFFCLPGLIALWGDGTAFSRLQPAIVETALCVLLGILAFTCTDLTAVLPSGYRKNLYLSAYQLESMKKTVRLLFYIISIHTLSSYFSILFLSGKTAAFISTPLLYILLGGFFIFLFIYNRLLRKKAKQEEWLPVVNEKGEVTGKAPRSVCHSGSRLLHPVVHLHIVSKQHELFLQKRSMKKDLLPGMWDTAVGGHIGLHEKVEDALKRETFEELGITNFEARFLGNYIWESPRERELVFSFLCTRHNQMMIANDEVDEGRFWSPSELEQGIREKRLTPNLIHEYQLLLKPILSSTKK